MRFITPFLVLAFVNTILTGIIANWMIPNFAAAAVMPLPIVALSFSTLWVASTAFECGRMMLLGIGGIAITIGSTAFGLGSSVSSATFASLGAMLILVVLPLVWFGIISSLLRGVGNLLGDRDQFFDVSLA